MIQYQILQTNITRTVWQTVRRITNKILGVKGLRNTLQWPISIINSFDKAKLSCNIDPTNTATLFLTPFFKNLSNRGLLVPLKLSMFCMFSQILLEQKP